MISDFEHKYEKEIEERLRSENTKESEVQKKKPNKKLTLIGLILTSTGGILYLLTSFIATQTEMGSNFPSASWPFLVAGVISLMGTMIGVKQIKTGTMIILLSLPVTFLIGVVYMPYLELYLYFITFVFVPIPLPHSVFVITGGILCLKSSDWKII